MGTCIISEDDQYIIVEEPITLLLMEQEDATILLEDTSTDFILLDDSAEILQLTEVEPTEILAEYIQSSLEDAVLNDDKHLDFNEDETQWYEGWAVPGSDNADPTWKIKSTWIVNAQGDTDSKWADGSASRNKVWDDRSTYTY